MEKGESHLGFLIVFSIETHLTKRDRPTLPEVPCYLLELVTQDAMK